MIAVIGNNCPRLFEKCLWNLSQSPLNSCSNNSTIFFHLEILLCWTAFCCGDQCLTGGILFSPWYHSWSTSLALTLRPFILRGSKYRESVLCEIVLWCEKSNVIELVLVAGVWLNLTSWCLPMKRSMDNSWWVSSSIAFAIRASISLWKRSLYIE